MKKQDKLISGIGCWAVFGIFLWGVVHKAHWITQLDRTGYQILQPTTVPRTHIFTAITHLGDPIILLPLSLVVLLLCWWRHHRNQGLWFAGLQLIGYLLVIITKYTILRPRPTHKLIPANGFSFPSGHTFATTVFVLSTLALILPHLKHRWQIVGIRICAIIWIGLVMASRVYLRNHFTSDVIGGLFLGSGWWLLATVVQDHLVNSRQQTNS